jgi:predicted small metal-binding protein
VSRIVRCECGTDVASSEDDELVALAADHAWRMHRMRLTRELVMSRAETNRAAFNDAERAPTEQGNGTVS